jgi:hypothetical protein
MIAFAFAALLAAGSLNEQWSFKVPANARIEAANINGRIRFEAGNDGEVQVRATAEDAGNFRPRVEQDGDTVRAEVCCGESCDTDDGRDRRGRRSCDGRIDFVLRVPAGAELTASNVSGAIDVAGVRGEQRLSNVSGRISVEGSENRLRIENVSGKVRIAPQRVARTSVHSVSGDVVLALPRNGGASVRLQTLSGEIEGAAEERSAGRGSRRVDVRGGGPQIDVETINGSVKLAER